MVTEVVPDIFFKDRYSLLLKERPRERFEPWDCAESKNGSKSSQKFHSRNSSQREQPQKMVQSTSHKRLGSSQWFQSKEGKLESRKRLRSKQKLRSNQRSKPKSRSKQRSKHMSRSRHMLRSNQRSISRLNHGSMSRQRSRRNSRSNQRLRQR